LMNTISSTPPTQNIAGWTEIPNSNSPTYDPPVISETTWYIRCARRAGCIDYTGESNVVEKTLLTECPSPYCETGGISTFYEWIHGIWLNDIDNVSGNNGGYADYTDISTDLTLGCNYVFHGQPGYSNYAEREYWRVWVDWNQDGDFEDEGELWFSKIRRGSFSKIAYVPVDALAGPTRMRVSMSWGGFAQPCSEYNYGETEDYTVNIVGNGNAFQSPEITVFEAEKAIEEQSVDLWWVNNTGDIIKRFELEHSTNGVDYKLINVEEHVEKNYELTRYNYLDTNPAEGDNYYRLKLIYEEERGVEYTEVKKVNFLVNPDYLIFPNPADTYVNISIQDAENQSAIVQLIDVNAKVLITQEVERITSEVIKLDLKEVIDGVYFININVEGQRSVTKRLIVNHLYGWKIQD